MSGFLTIYTVVHVAISLVAIASGSVVISQWLRRRESNRWAAVFLTMTILTSVTGFGFPATKITPGHVFGVLSLIALGLAVYGKYARHRVGKWNVIYILSALFAQYLNVFVLIVQSFQKIPALHALAPTQSEAPFAVAQGLTLVAFVVIAVKSVRGPRLTPQA